MRWTSAFFLSLKSYIHFFCSVDGSSVKDKLKPEVEDFAAITLLRGENVTKTALKAIQIHGGSGYINYLLLRAALTGEEWS